MDETPKPGSKNMLIIIVLTIVVLVGGGWFIFGNKSNTTSITESPTDEATTQNITSPTTSSPATNEREAEKGEVKTFTVSAKPFAYTPQEIRVKTGDTVKIVLTVEAGNHDWVVDEFNARTKMLSAGQTETIEFVADKAGTYEYYCSVGNHRQMGMVGKLIVE